MSTNALVALAALSAKQFGVFTRRQALDSGFSPSAITRLVRSGRWVALHAGVYRDAAVPPLPEQHAMAAWLAVGPRAAVAFATAARVWGLEVDEPAMPQIVVPETRKLEITGIDVSRSRHMGALDVVGLKGMRVTSPSRTLLDLAGESDETALELLLDSAWGRGLVDPDRLSRLLARRWCLSRRGAGALRKLVDVRIGAKAPDSKLESLFFTLVRRAAMPLPVRQHPVWTPGGWRYIDFAYVEQRVAIELEGLASRRSRERFDAEPARQNEIQQLGWAFRRYTWNHVTTRPVWTIANLAEAIGLFPVGWRRATAPGHVTQISIRTR